MMACRMIALLRGINVGRAKRVAMADLRTLVEGLGYRNVRTVLNSGNIIFTSSRGTPATAATRIEVGLATQLGVSARVLVLTASELARALAENPLSAATANPSRFLVAVLADTRYQTQLKPLLKQDWTPEALALGQQVAYLWCAEGILESRLLSALGRALGDGVTTRNWTTMLKLQALAGEPG
jgi:uncharacterized protein (DUF1697 family)